MLHSPAATGGRDRVHARAGAAGTELTRGSPPRTGRCPPTGRNARDEAPECAEVATTGGHAVPTISMRQLLEAGVHFGHPDSPLEPQDEAIHLRRAQRSPHHRPCPDGQAPGPRARVRHRDGCRGDSVLFVGTNSARSRSCRRRSAQASPTSPSAGLAACSPTGDHIRKRVGLLDQLEARQLAGDFDRLPKKEAALLTEELNMLGGIRKMKRLPAAVFIVDPPS